MDTVSRQYRCFALGFLLAWALSHASVVNAQNETKLPAERPALTDKIRKTLDQVIALDYQGNSFNEAISHLKDRTQLPIVVDQVALQQMGLVDGQPLNIELRSGRGKVRHAIQHLLNSHNLTYVILEDSLLITTEETAMLRQMRQRVPVDVAEVPAAKAMRDLARQAGVSLVLDPRVAKIANQSVTLQLEEASVETALRLVAEFVDLKAVRMGNVVFVTDPARAERIRKEEPANLGLEARMGIFGLQGGVVGGGGIGIGNIAVPPAVEAPPAPEKKE